MCDVSEGARMLSRAAVSHVGRFRQVGTHRVLERGVFCAGWDRVLRWLSRLRYIFAIAINQETCPPYGRGPWRGERGQPRRGTCAP